MKIHRWIQADWQLQVSRSSTVRSNFPQRTEKKINQTRRVENIHYQSELRRLAYFLRSDL